MKDITKLKIPDKVIVEEFDICVRPYLYLDDIIEIGEAMLGCDNVVTQDAVMTLEVLDRCTDIDKELITIPSEEDSEEDEFIGFDLIYLSGLKDAVFNKIQNINEVWAYVDSKSDVSAAMAHFIRNDLTVAMDRITEILQKWEKKMPKGKQWNEIMTSLPDNLSKALTTIKDDGNAEIINNAMKMSRVEKEEEDDN